MRDYFDFAVTSVDCGFEKPDKRFFEFALQTAEKELALENAISPSSVLHIGDRYNEDYQGSINAGFQVALLLDPNDKCEDFNSAHRIKDLSECLEKLKTIFAEKV